MERTSDLALKEKVVNFKPERGEHPAANRWASEAYAKEKGAGGHSLQQLETIVRRNSQERLPSDPTQRKVREAEHKARRDELAERKQEMGLK